MTYEDLLSVSDSIGLITREKDLLAYDGRIKGNRVAIRKTIPTQAAKACVLAEELGHFFTSTGDILEQNSTAARKQERRARAWAYDFQIGLDGIISAYEHGCGNMYEIAEYLDTTVDFLSECLSNYRERYGTMTHYGGYTILLDPMLKVISNQGESRYDD